MKTLGKYLYDIALSIDQLGNTLAGGNPDCTISARTYVMVQQGEKPSRFWIMLRWVIDYAFYPVDGPEHCQQAWRAEQNEVYYAPSTITIIVFSLLIIPICLAIIRPIAWLFGEQNA